MGKLHELIAVEGDLKGTYNRIIGETKTNFSKHPDRYQGSVKKEKYFDTEAPDVQDVEKTLDDTVYNKLEYTSEHIIRYIDAVYQKEKTNTVASADIIVNGNTIATNVPATFLLGMEAKLQFVRDNVYAQIPTLAPGIDWVPDPEHQLGEGVSKQAKPDQNWRTKKIRKAFVKYEATKEHPAQVETYTEDEKVSEVLTYNWSGMISPAKKSEILGRIDALIRAIKEARQRANSVEANKDTIGKEIFDYING